MGNFKFLKDNFFELYETTEEAEKNLFEAPTTSAIYSRKALELAVKIIYRNERFAIPGEGKLEELLRGVFFVKEFGEHERTMFHYVRKLGNLAVHGDRKISQEEALEAIRILYKLSSWIGYCYGNLEEEREFDSSLIRQTTQRKVEELEKIIENLKAGKMTELSKETVETPKKKAKTLHIQASNEAQTRKIYIDIMLEEAGWNLSEWNVKEFPVKGMPSNSGDGFVDYVLWGKDGKPLALVEAKKTERSPLDGQNQGKLYADCLEGMTGKRPVIFYSNGYETYIWNDGAGEAPRLIYGFYRREELEYLIQKRDGEISLEEKLKKIDNEIAGRSYQIQAITKTIETFHEKKRKALLIMATGTGKTRVSIGIVKALLETNSIKRVLFLADRTALVVQAQRNFVKHIQDTNMCNLTEDKENKARIVFSTYQTMINEIDALRKDGTRKYGVGYFDLIIVDESHRSIYKKYGIIFDYFDSNILGLTATPKEEIDKNTYRVFNLPNGEPTFAYGLTEAVKDGFLVPPVAEKIDLKFPTEGIKYSELSEDDQEQWEDTFDDGVEEVEAEAVNNWLFNRDTVRQVLRLLMEEGHRVKGGDKLGKTVMFAKNDKHADFIVEIFNSEYPHLGGSFCQKITNKVSYAQNIIDNFSISSKDPQIAVSVDMLDTGIDVPEILNLVIVKKIRSKSKFWQMVGRGTRLCKDIFEPGKDKNNFKIFDFCQNIEYFEALMEDDKKGGKDESLSQRLFNMKIKLAFSLQGFQFQEDEETKKYYDKLVKNLQKNIESIDKRSAQGRQAIRYLEKYSRIEELNNLDDMKISEIKGNLSNLPFQTEKESEEIKRFDLLMYHLQLGNIEENRYKRAEKSCVEISRNLSGKTSVPVVKEKIEDIKLLGDVERMNTLSLKRLEELRENLRDLMTLIIGDERLPFFTDFKDEIIKKESGNINTGFDHMTFDEKLKRFLDTHRDELCIKKLKNAIQLDKQDIGELEKLIFSEEVGSKEELEKNYKGKIDRLKSAYGDNYLAAFLRTMTGIDKEKLDKSFSKFIKVGTLSGLQSDVIKIIINSYISNGEFSEKDLFDNKEIKNRLGNKIILDIFNQDELKEISFEIKSINESVRGI